MRRLTGYLALAAIGAWFSYGLLEARARTGLATDPVIIALVLLGGAILLPVVVFAVRGNDVGSTWAEFWGLPRITRHLVTLSAGFSVVVVWDIVLLLIADRMAGRWT